MSALLPEPLTRSEMDKIKKRLGEERMYPIKEALRVLKQTKQQPPDEPPKPIAWGDAEEKKWQEDPEYPPPKNQKPDPYPEQDHSEGCGWTREDFKTSGSTKMGAYEAATKAFEDLWKYQGEHNKPNAPNVQEILRHYWTSHEKFEEGMFWCFAGVIGKYWKLGGGKLSEGELRKEELRKEELSKEELSDDELPKGELRQEDPSCCIIQ